MARPRTHPPFDPYAILAALEQERVAYILIGAFARVIVGADEITRGVDITPSAKEENLRRLHHALETINARSPDGSAANVQTHDYAREPVVALRTDHGEVKVVPFTDGTRGYDDLRRAAERQPLGHGFRPSVASPGDLARMLSALGREQDIPNLIMMRRLIELEYGLHHGLSIER